jgi:hypothetical protein
MSDVYYYVYPGSSLLPGGERDRIIMRIINWMEYDTQPLKPTRGASLRFVVEIKNNSSTLAAKLLMVYRNTRLIYWYPTHKRLVSFPNSIEGISSLWIYKSQK